jgi:hypothetical protein
MVPWLTQDAHRLRRFEPLLALDRERCDWDYHSEVTNHPKADIADRAARTGRTGRMARTAQDS